MPNGGKRKRVFRLKMWLKILSVVLVIVIAASAILLITPENFPDWKSWLIFAAALAATLIGKLSPIIAIIAGGVIGILIY